MPSTDGEYCVGDNAVNQPGAGNFFTAILHECRSLLKIAVLVSSGEPKYGSKINSVLTKNLVFVIKCHVSVSKYSAFSFQWNELSASFLPEQI